MVVIIIVIDRIVHQQCLLLIFLYNEVSSSPHSPAVMLTSAPTMAANAPRSTAIPPLITMPSPVSVSMPSTHKLPSLLDNLSLVPLFTVDAPPDHTTNLNIDDLTVPLFGESLDDELLPLPEVVRLSPCVSYTE
jgi:hypothetical protein